MDLVKRRNINSFRGREKARVEKTIGRQALGGGGGREGSFLQTGF